MTREVEIKFLVQDVPALEAKLRSAGFQQESPPKHEMNTLYDQRGHPLRRRGELLRLREFGGEWKLTHKAPARSGRRHKTRVELETSIANGAQMDAILHALGFEPGFRYEKFRSEWSDGQGHVVIDKTPIGDVAEVEGEPAWIDATATKLGVAEAEYITKNYAEMFIEWRRRTRSKAVEMTFAECSRP